MKNSFHVGQKVYSRAHGSMMKDVIFTIKSFSVVRWCGAKMYEYTLNDGSQVFEDMLRESE